MTEQRLSPFERGALFFLAVLLVVLYGWSLTRMFGGGDDGHHGALPERAPLVVVDIEPLAPLHRDREITRGIAQRDAYARSVREFSQRMPSIGHEVVPINADVWPPRREVLDLPDQMRTIDSAAERKQLFVKFMLPMVARANEDVMVKREKLFRIEAKILRGQRLSDAEHAWLGELAESYDLEKWDFAGLKRRVDVVPLSLALAQAAEESGWGTSRFARVGNNLFGMRAAADAPAMRALERPNEDGVLVRVFDHVEQSVRSYIHNLNTHRSYEKFRSAREEQRVRKGGVDGWSLAGTLDRYAERGADYVRTIRSIIDHNGFKALDKALPVDPIPPAVR